MDAKEWQKWKYLSHGINTLIWTPAGSIAHVNNLGGKFQNKVVIIF
jgi:hypothetical protein